MADMRGLDRIVGLLLIALSGGLVLYSFWDIGRNVRDALVLTGYVTRVAPSEQRSFGYGGEAQSERVDVPFQGRDISNVSFFIFRDAAGAFFVKGRDDEIVLRRRRYKRGEAAPLSHGDVFEAHGPLSRAAFTAHIEGGDDTLRLLLRTPVFRDLRSSSAVTSTRLVIAPQISPVPIPIDEVFFRTPDRARARAYRVWVEARGLRIREEEDFAADEAGREASGQAEQGGGRSPAPPFDAEQPTGEAALLRPGETRAEDPVEYGFRHYTAPLIESLGVRKVTIFGLRFFLAALLVGAALSGAPAARWPFGTSIFGCALLLASIGAVLAARDYFFHPHHPRFQEYLRYLFASAVVLVALRVPFNPDSRDSIARFARPLGAAYLSLLLAFLLLDESFDGSPRTLWLPVLGALKTLLGFAAALFVSAVLQLLVRLELNGLSGAAVGVRQFRRLLLVPFLLIVAGLVLTRALGGREAVTILGARVHLPSLLLPLVVLWTAVLVWIAEAREKHSHTWLTAAVVMVLLSVFAYRLASHDNGGALVLAVGVVSVLMLSRSRLSFRLTALLLVLCGGVALGWASQSVRFELAWGGEEGRVLFYDAAKNLRLARDMARAGGLGSFTALFIPSELRSNLHSDLAAAYVVGFFGWLAFGALLAAYILLYNHLFVGLYRKLLRRGGDTDEAAVRPRQPRRLLLLYGAALVLTFALQAAYVISATLQRYVPLTGLDLQPVSTSAISVLNFFVVLLGSVALIHVFDRTLPE